jgi:putative glutamine amidotransferase
MKWLVSDPLKDDATDRYRSWLAHFSVSAEWRGPGQGVPAGLETFTALLLTGGGDLDPSFYNRPGDPDTRGVRKERDRFELDLVRAFLDAGKPVFGICRGLQVLNVAFGGALIQHVPSWLGEHSGEEHRPRGAGDSAHALTLVRGTRLAGALGGVADVNSAHHQAVDPGALGRGLRVCAASPAGIIEAVENADAPGLVSAVQWHPERLSPRDHPASRALMEWWKSLSRA